MACGAKKLCMLLCCASLFAGCQHTPPKDNSCLSPSDTIIVADESDECFLDNNLCYIARGFDEDKTEYNYTQADVLLSVYFDFDISTLTTADKQQIADVSKIMSKNHDFSVLLVGLCDKFGSEQYNVKLGRQRAESVRDVLLSLGVLPSHIKIASLGSAKADCQISKKADGARDRRCDIVLLK